MVKEVTQGTEAFRLASGLIGIYFPFKALVVDHTATAKQLINLCCLCRCGV